MKDLTLLNATVCTVYCLNLNSLKDSADAVPMPIILSYFQVRLILL